MVRITVLPSKVTSLRWTILSIYRIWGTIVKIQNSSALYLHFFSVCARTDGYVRELFTMKLTNGLFQSSVLSFEFVLLYSFYFQGEIPKFYNF